MDEFKDTSRENLILLIAELRQADHEAAAAAADRLAELGQAIAERDEAVVIAKEAQALVSVRQTEFEQAIAQRDALKPHI
jgi:hypothetical protein